MEFFKKHITFLFILFFLLPVCFNSGTDSSFSVLAVTASTPKKKQISTSKKSNTKNKKSSKNKQGKNNKKQIRTKKTQNKGKINSGNNNKKQEQTQNLESVAANPKLDYAHSSTKTVFPYKLTDFERKQIIAYEKDPNKIDVIYESPSSNKKIWFKISLLPTYEAVEGRLRDEYIHQIEKNRNKNKKWETPNPILIKEYGSKYICNGIKGTFHLTEKKHRQVRVYECGTWLFSLFLSSDNSDEDEFEKTADMIADYFKPEHLTELKPLNIKPNISFERELLKDTVFMGPMIGSGFTKLDWVRENVRENERASGFPDLYLPMHLAAMDKFLQLASKKRMSNSLQAQKYYEDLLEIKQAGFMSEFIMEQFNKVMIVPPNIKLNYDAFHQWRAGKNISVDLNKKWYIICYRK
ncbi:exported hypothetical protein [uncultured Paludibacter sp.]|nr:exported hypothetical protein [uncultured Paludibacter sp.]